MLRECLSDILEDATNELAGPARLVIERAQTQWRELDEHIACCDQRIAAHLKDDDPRRSPRATRLINSSDRVACGWYQLTASFALVVWTRSQWDLDSRRGSIAVVVIATA